MAYGTITLMQIGSRPVQGVGLLGAGALALWWSWDTPATFFPDGYELAAAGACLWGLPENTALPCAAMDPGYTTPLFPLLSGPASWAFGGLYGVVVLALACLSLSFVPLSRLASQLGGQRAALGAFVMLASSQELRAWSMVPDERPLALLLAASAWAVGITSRTPWSAALAGVLAGLAGWARPEALVVAVLIPLTLLAWDRRKGLAAALGAGLLMAGWLGVQRLLGGTWLPRPYEVAALELLRVLPDNWAKRLVGMGAWSPPLRAWGLVHGIAAPSGGMFPDPLAGIRWAGQALAQGTHPAHWLLAGIGIASGLWQTARRRALIAAAGLAAPWLIASALLHARLDALPLANLLAVLLILCVLAGAGAAHLAEWLTAWLPKGSTSPAALVLTAAIAMAAGSTWPRSPVRPGIELSPPGAAATDWLRANPGTVTSTYETAPVVFRAEQPWQEWPTPFEPERWAGVDWVVRSHLDTPEPPTLSPGGPTLEAVDGWAVDDRWVRIYRVASE